MSDLKGLQIPSEHAHDFSHTHSSSSSNSSVISTSCRLKLVSGDVCDGFWQEDDGMRERELIHRARVLNRSFRASSALHRLLQRLCQLSLKSARKAILLAPLSFSHSLTFLFIPHSSIRFPFLSHSHLSILSSGGGRWRRGGRGGRGRRGGSVEVARNASLELVIRSSEVSVLV